MVFIKWNYCISLYKWYTVYFNYIQQELKLLFESKFKYINGQMLLVLELFLNRLIIKYQPENLYEIWFAIGIIFIKTFKTMYVNIFYFWDVLTKIVPFHKSGHTHIYKPVNSKLHLTGFKVKQISGYVYRKAVVLYHYLVLFFVI